MGLNKQLNLIEESDLQELIDNQVSEHKTVEYKAALPSNSEGDKKEFLADVSSLANAAGGHLIFGIKEDAGMPVELCGLQINDIDAAILRLESIIQTGIAPRLFRMVETHPVSLSSKQQSYAIVIHVRKSWISPHMVKSDSKFHVRNSRGKYQLDVGELRAAFLLSETATERIRNFRTERLSNLMAGETPAQLDEHAPKIVLHIVPFGAFDPAARFNMTLLTQSDHVGYTEPLKLLSGGYQFPRYNFDGLLNREQGTYMQAFRNGSIEAVDTTILSASREMRTTSGNIYEKRLLEALKRYTDAQKLIGVEPPLFIMVSFLGIQGFHVGFNGFDTWIPQDRRIDRSDLIIPEVMMDGFDCDFSEVMKPIFDTIANAAMWSCSMMYDESGKSLHGL